MNPLPGLYGWHHGKGGVHWYRMAEPLRVSQRNGLRVGVGDRLDDDVCANFDTILVHMLWDEHSSEAWEKLAAGRMHRLIFDIDDAMWAPDYKPFADHYDDAVLQRVYRNIQLSHVVTTPSPHLADEVRHRTGHPNIHVVPNTVPEWLLRWRMPDRPYPLDMAGWRRRCAIERPPIVVGYQGSSSHIGDFSPTLLAWLAAWLDDGPPAWTLHFWGEHDTTGWPAHRVGHTPWQDSVRAYYRSLSMDAGIGPLQATAFNRCKSSLRAVEYAALGIVPVLSALTPYIDQRTPGGIGVVDHGETGVLVPAGNVRAWYDALWLVCEDIDYRHALSRNAREAARRWTTEANLFRWVDAWNSAGDYA